MTGKEKTYRFTNWDEWQSQGFDSGSVFQDPMFADPANGDYTLKEDSPALAMGFKQMELGKFGPQEPIRYIHDLE